MNLTFYDNKKESKISSFNSIYNKKQFPSVFSKFETEKYFSRDSFCIKLAKSKIFLPRYKNIKIEMEKFKKQCRHFFDIKDTVFKEMITKESSSTYQNFIRGFGKYFFGQFGLVTKKYKYLKDYYLRKSILNDKIFAGKLEYYDYISKFNRFRQRQNNTSKRILTKSQNYAVLDDNNNLFTLRALTSKKFLKRTDYVSLNRYKYKPLKTEINEWYLRKLKLKNELSNNENRIKHKSILKNKMIDPIYIKTYDNFYLNNKNIYDNYKKAVIKIRDKDYKNKLLGLYNTDKTRTNSQTSSGNDSNLFLTQTQGNKGTLTSKSKKDVWFNNNINIFKTKNKMSLKKPKSIRNVSFKI